MISGLLRNTASTLAIKAGPNNPVVRAMMRILCRPLVLKFENDHIDVSKDARTIRLAAKHFPYALDMAEHFDLYFNQVVPENGGAGLLVDYSGPKLQRYKNGLEFELSSFPEELEVIEEYFHWYKPKPDDLIFDIGAYCGVTAYHLSKCVPGGKLYSFEPDPINFRLLTRNVERHGLKNVTPPPFWHFRQDRESCSGEDPDMDCGLGLRAGSDRAKAVGTAGESLPNSTDSQRHPFRESAHFTGSRSTGPPERLSRGPQPVDSVQLLTGQH